MSLLKDIRDRATLAATFWKSHVVNDGVRLTLRDASPRVRYGLVTGYELEDSTLARQVLEPGDGVLELGSSIGFMALFCRTQLGVENYAMVEANPRLVPLIQENFRLNGAELPHFFNVAVGPEDGEVTFRVNRDYWSSSIMTRDNEADALTVAQRSIPSLIAELPYRPNTLIIDIEGGEIQIPDEHWLLFDKIIAEFHERIVGDAPIQKIRDLLTGAGFEHVASKGCSHAFVRKAQ